MAMSEEERAITIRDSIQNSGQSFENMGRFMRKAVARQIGMSTEAASKFLQSSTASVKDIRKLMDAETRDIDVLMGKSADGVKNMGDGAAANAVSIKESIVAMLESALAFESVLGTMRTTTQALLGPAGKLTGMFKSLADPFLKKITELARDAAFAANRATGGGGTGTTQPGRSAPSQFSSHSTIKIYLDGTEIRGAVKKVVNEEMKKTAPGAS